MFEVMKMSRVTQKKKTTRKETKFPSLKFLLQRGRETLFHGLQLQSYLIPLRPFVRPRGKKRDTSASGRQK